MVMRAAKMVVAVTKNFMASSLVKKDLILFAVGT
jgi:hypothetical protein